MERYIQINLKLKAILNKFIKLTFQHLNMIKV